MPWWFSVPSPIAPSRTTILRTSGIGVVIAAACVSQPGGNAVAPSFSASAAPTSAPFIVDGASRGRTFDGIGGVSSGGSSRLLYDYPEKERAQILDYMFRPGYGAALQLLKVEIGGEVNGTVGAEATHMRARDQIKCDRGYEWWLMREARKRNPAIRFVGLEWGAPGWLDGGTWSRDNITYISAWLDCARSQGVKVDYVGGWNESGFNAPWFVDFARELNRTHPDVKIVAADNAHTGQWSVAAAMVRDSAFSHAVDIVGVHGPGGSRTDPEYLETHNSDAARSLGKPLWASELSSLAHNVGAPSLARAFNRAYIDARITGQMIWTPISAWYSTLPIADTGPIVAEWPWSGYYDVGASVWSLAHTTQFTEPGWSYLDIGSARLPSGATIASFISPSGADYSMVVEAMDVKNAETLDLELRNLPRRDVQLWVTDLSQRDPSRYFRRAASPAGGGTHLRFTIEPRHIYTISTLGGAGHGTASSSAAPAEQLALPFRETFDALPADQLARFFSDVSGSFLTAPCAGGRSGMCFQQFVDRQPVDWHGPDMPPTTIAGDPRWWGDYRVSAEVLIPSGGSVELLGRVDGVGGDEFLSGYHLQLAATGDWQLYSEDISGADTTLAVGRVPMNTAAWHNVALGFQGAAIRVFIDGREVTIAHDDRHRIGQVGLRTSKWSTAQFDDIQVSATGPVPQFIPKSEMLATTSSLHPGNALGYEHPASAAIDDRPETYWRSEWEGATTLPQSITLDLGRVQDVRAVMYRPRISGHWAARNPGNAITRYALYLGDDERNFEKVATGTWRSTTATPRVVAIAGQRRGRYVRLEAFANALDCETSVTVGEIDVSTTPIADPTPSVAEIPPQFESVVPRDRITARAAGGTAGHDASRATDGDCTTFWEVAASGAPARVITLELSGSHEVSGLAYLPRQDDVVKGAITRYAISVSTDGQQFTPVSEGEWAPTPVRKYATWGPRSARYVRLEAIAGAEGGVAAGEIHIGTGR